MGGVDDVEIRRATSILIPPAPRSRPVYFRPVNTRERSEIVVYIRHFRESFLELAMFSRRIQSVLDEQFSVKRRRFPWLSSRTRQLLPVESFQVETWGPFLKKTSYYFQQYRLRDPGSGYNWKRPALSNEKKENNDGLTTWGNFSFVLSCTWCNAK